jgi:indolepyruvate ferredoxin oxidoreductase alpha subunit
LEKIEKIKKELANDDRLNRIENKDAKSKLGLVTTGVAYHYAKEALKNLGLDIPILKIGLSFPFDQEKIISFAKNLNQVLVVEEIDGVVEEEVKKVLVKDIKIFGKDKLPQEGELRPETVTKVLAEIAGKREPIDSNFDDKEVPTRIPFFCPGCPHRGSFYAIKKALGDKKIYGGDIGCYMLGAYQPNELMDFIVSMGSSISLSHGISKATGEKPIALIGDGTFFHAGLPALVNLVYNHDDILLIVLDNRFTAMTGQQPNPGTGSTEPQGVGKVKIEEIAKSVGADNVAVANAFNPKKTTETVKELYGQKGVSVLVIKGDCRMAPEQKKIVSQKPKYQFKKSARLDKQERENLESIGCPAISLDKDRENIDQDICVGCSLCAQIDPDDIEINKRKGKDE